MAATGKKILSLSRKHLGEKYILGVLAPKNNGKWKGPWDCAEFASWLVYQAGEKLYGCHKNNCDPAVADAYTGHWARDAKSLGKMISIEEAARIPGAAVLRIPKTGSTGHIVISDGKGGTVEAHSSKLGVIASKLAGRRWDMGILVPGITYTESRPVTVALPSGVIYRLKTPRMKGEDITLIQRALTDNGYDTGGIDGVFGPKTHAAVIAFQLAYELVADGEVGSVTKAALGLL